MQSRTVRVAAAALALSGAGLMITGVANAVTAPGLAPERIIGGPQEAVQLPSAGSSSDPAGTDPAPTGDPVTDPTSVPATVPTKDPLPPVSATATPSSPAASVPAAKPSGRGSGTPAAGSGATRTAGTARSGGSTMSQAPAVQTLAETGNSGVGYLVGGGVTLLAGGLVFRFGPRTAAPRHGA